MCWASPGSLGSLEMGHNYPKLEWSQEHRGFWVGGWILGKLKGAIGSEGQGEQVGTQFFSIVPGRRRAGPLGGESVAPQSHGRGHWLPGDGPPLVGPTCLSSCSAGCREGQCSITTYLLGGRESGRPMPCSKTLSQHVRPCPKDLLYPQLCGLSKGFPKGLELVSQF